MRPLTESLRRDGAYLAKLWADYKPGPRVAPNDYAIDSTRVVESIAATILSNTTLKMFWTSPMFKYVLPERFFLVTRYLFIGSTRDRVYCCTIEKPTGSDIIYMDLCRPSPNDIDCFARCPYIDPMRGLEWQRNYRNRVESWISTCPYV